jgi:hypothetical protein
MTDTADNPQEPVAVMLADPDAPPVMRRVVKCGPPPPDVPFAVDFAAVLECGHLVLSPVPVPLGKEFDCMFCERDMRLHGGAKAN